MPATVPPDAPLRSPSESVTRDNPTGTFRAPEEAMPQARLSMRKIREILRFAATGLSARQIGVSVGIARSTVSECLRRAEAAQIAWPLPDDLDDGALVPNRCAAPLRRSSK